MTNEGNNLHPNHYHGLINNTKRLTRMSLNGRQHKTQEAKIRRI
jgi:hypothetical protein